MLKKILLYIWQLPQNLLGLLLFACYNNTERFKYRGKLYQRSNNTPGSISLGEYILTGSRYQETWDHEYGHTVQSKMFGPLYLIIIGLWSLQEVFFDRDGDYYDDFPEKQADRYGGIVIDENGNRVSTYVGTDV